MNARATEPKPGEATVVNLARAEKSAPKAEAPQSPPQQAPQAPVVTEAAPKKRGSRRLILMIVVPLVLIVAGAWFYLTGGRYQDTDNSNVEQAKVSLSADIAGLHRLVLGHIDRRDAAGDVLFTIDPQPYQIALAQANAALATARVNVQQLKVSFSTAEANLKSAQATNTIQQATFDRQQALVTQAVASSSTLDKPKLDLQAAQNAVVTAQNQVASATAALGGDPAIDTDKHPAVLAALAAVDAAQRNLTKTQVLAPADGVISQVSSLNVGQFVATGTTIAMLVETDGSWLEANFKETQLTDIRVGMPADVSVDAFPGVKLKGKVTSIGAATGAEFSLIPAQNATGNWVKVVQRIPVRVDLDTAASVPLRSGMSATVSVDTGHSTLDKMTGK